jgi:hypothetical protein
MREMIGKTIAAHGESAFPSLVIARSPGIDGDFHLNLRNGINLRINLSRLRHRCNTCNEGEKLPLLTNTPRRDITKPKAQ